MSIPQLSYRIASVDDAAAIAVMNAQLLYDEGNCLLLSQSELTERMADWLANEYGAVVFEERDTERSHALGYALYRFDAGHVFLRQFYVKPLYRRFGVGRKALDWLQSTLWTNASLRLEVLKQNATGQAFWRAMGFQEYCVTTERSAPVWANDEAADSTTAPPQLSGHAGRSDAIERCAKDRSLHPIPDPASGVPDRK